MGGGGGQSIERIDAKCAKNIANQLVTSRTYSACAVCTAKQTQDLLFAFEQK